MMRRKQNSGFSVTNRGGETKGDRCSVGPYLQKRIVALRKPVDEHIEKASQLNEEETGRPAKGNK